MNLAVIPARGGSKRIPQKNIRNFVGKPIIAYSIEAALESGVFDAVWVSTDSEEIANVARHYGAEVPFLRPKELADDYTGTHAVTRHAIREAQQIMGGCEYCCCIYATAPLLQPQYLKEGFERLKQDQDKAFAFSVTSFPFPVQRALTISNNAVGPMFAESINKRSQDLEEAFHDAGQFYWGRGDDYLSNKTLFSEHSIPIVIPRHLVQDIDTNEDWVRAELMYRAFTDTANGICD